MEATGDDGEEGTYELTCAAGRQLELTLTSALPSRLAALDSPSLPFDALLLRTSPFSMPVKKCAYSHQLRMT